MPGYTLFLEIDGVERKINAYQSLVKSPKGDYVKVWYSDLQEDDIDADTIDKLNKDVKDKKFNPSIYKKDEFDYRTTALNDDGLYEEIYLYRNDVKFEEPKPFDPYANNPNKELCNCKKSIAIFFYHQWWCDECHSKQNWN